MEPHDARRTSPRKHLLTKEQLASHAGASADDLADGRRHGNGFRVHRTYILVVSLVTLALVVVTIAVASATM